MGCSPSKGQTAVAIKENNNQYHTKPVTNAHPTIVPDQQETTGKPENRQDIYTKKDSLSEVNEEDVHTVDSPIDKNVAKSVDNIKTSEENVSASKESIKALHSEAIDTRRGSYREDTPIKEMEEPRIDDDTAKLSDAEKLACITEMEEVKRDSPKPDSVKPDSPKPDSPKPDSPKPEPTISKSPKPESPKPSEDENKISLSNEESNGYSVDQKYPTGAADEQLENKDESTIENKDESTIKNEDLIDSKDTDNNDNVSEENNEENNTNETTDANETTNAKDTDTKESFDEKTEEESLAKEKLDNNDPMYSEYAAGIIENMSSTVEVLT